MDNYKEFNTALKFFIRECTRIYPHISELKLLMPLYKVMKTMNKKLPMKYYKELMDPHTKNLLNKDLEFFLNYNYEDPTVIRIVNALKAELHRTSEENKDMIWRHLIVLYKYTRQCKSISTDAQKLPEPISV